MDVDGVAPGVLAEDCDRAGAEPELAEQSADRGRLAGAVGAQEAVDLTGADGQVQSVQGGDGAETFDE